MSSHILNLTLASVLAVAVSASSASAQKKYDTGATDTEIKVGQTVPLSGPASAYSTVGKTQAAYIQMINDEGGVNGRKVNLIQYDDAYTPPKTVEQVRKLVESDEVLLTFQIIGTAPNAAVQKYHQHQEGAAAVRRDRRLEVHRSEEFSMDDGLQSELLRRGPDLRPVHSEGASERQGRRALPERRPRQGLPRRHQGRARRQGRHDGGGGDILRVVRADDRFADPAESRTPVRICSSAPRRRNRPRRRSRRSPNSAGTPCISSTSTRPRWARS